jgi:hypothetical protein
MVWNLSEDGSIKPLVGGGGKIYLHNLGTTHFKLLFEKNSNVVFYMKSKLLWFDV